MRILAITTHRYRSSIIERTQDSKLRPQRTGNFSDWYHEQMDPLIDNDTHASLHCTLSPYESRRLLETVFPDDALFPPTTGPSGSESNMTQLLDFLRNQGIYKRSNKRDGAECWHQFWSCRGKNSESSIARFLNGIMKAAKKVVGESSIQRLVSLSRHTTHMRCIDEDAQNVASH